MAVTKIHAIKSTLGKALAYIENPDKTAGQLLVSGYNCEPKTVNKPCLSFNSILFAGGCRDTGAGARAWQKAGL